RADVVLALFEQRDDLAADLVGIGKTDALDFAQINTVDDQRCEFTAKDVETLLADADNLDRLAARQKLARMVAGKAGKLRIEAAAKTALGRADDEQVHVVRAGTGHQT